MPQRPDYSAHAHAVPSAAIGFRPEFLDFRRGIHVGNLEDNERITRILKLGLESRYRQPFVTERWGRGVYWHWVGYLPRTNREAKPLSNKVSFGCSKFFLSVDTEEGLFKCGLQVERGYLKAPQEFPACKLERDWDWHRLMRGIRSGGPLERELRRLVVREGFRIRAGSWGDDPVYLSKANYAGTSGITRTLRKAPADDWAGFQLFYAMDQDEVRSSNGVDLVESMMAVFDEVRPVMNRCMQIELI
ncbi:MAG TPA: hypothetical protein VFL79_07145 [Terriglobia bacterium]|nr:hypothetical protein [Terriglobia bacterium]